jgi:peptidoglycan/LPS O-acetylase OafA/YrhL
MAVAYLEQRASGWFRAARWRGTLALVAGLALFLAANSWFSAVWRQSGRMADFWMPVGFPVAVCVGLGLMLFSVCLASPTRWDILRLPPVVWIGNISYSFFLYHIGVQVAIQRIFPVNSSLLGFRKDLVQALIALPPSLALSAVMFVLVERPCLRAMARLKARRKEDGRRFAEKPDSDISLPSTPRTC